MVGRLVSSKRNQRKRACTHKCRYPTAAAGRLAIWQLNRVTYLGHMNVYHCKFCQRYHIGHSPASH